MSDATPVAGKGSGKGKGKGQGASAKDAERAARAEQRARDRAENEQAKLRQTHPHVFSSDPDPHVPRDGPVYACRADGCAAPAFGAFWALERHLYQERHWRCRLDGCDAALFRSPKARLKHETKEHGGEVCPVCLATVKPSLDVFDAVRDHMERTHPSCHTCRDAAREATAAASSGSSASSSSSAAATGSGEIESEGKSGASAAVRAASAHSGGVETTFFYDSAELERHCRNTGHRPHPAQLTRLYPVAPAAALRGPPDSEALRRVHAGLSADAAGEPAVPARITDATPFLLADATADAAPDSASVASSARSRGSRGAPHKKEQTVSVTLPLAARYTPGASRGSMALLPHHSEHCGGAAVADEDKKVLAGVRSRLMYEDDAVVVVLATERSGSVAARVDAAVDLARECGRVTHLPYLLALAHVIWANHNGNKDGPHGFYPDRVKQLFDAKEARALALRAEAAKAAAASAGAGDAAAGQLR